MSRFAVLEAMLAEGVQDNVQSGPKKGKSNKKKPSVLPSGPPVGSASNGVGQSERHIRSAVAAAFTSGVQVGSEAVAQQPATSSVRAGMDCTGVDAAPLLNPLIWLDLEMTGLDISKHTIIEAACILTDGDMSTTLEGPCLVIHQADTTMADMNDWCVEHHGRSGLTQRVAESTTSMAEAEEALLDFVSAHVPPGVGLLAGNSIHNDRVFLSKYMPRFTSYLHYRMVDVTSVAELAKRWYPGHYKKAPRKTLAHTALSDIKESIEELQYWRRKIFIKPDE